LIFSAWGWHGIFAGGKTAHAFEFDTDRVIWNRLSFRAQNIFGKVTTDIHLKFLPIDKAGSLSTIDPAGDALLPSGATILTLTVRSQINPWIGSAETLETETWFDPLDAAALQRVRRRQGKERWQKTYRYTKTGVFREKKKPASQDEIDGTPGQWSNIKESFHPYTLSSAGCSHALDPLTLLFIGSALDLDSNKKTLSLCVFNKKQLHQVRIRKAGVKRVVVDYIEEIKESKIRRQGETEAIKYLFKTRSLAGKDKKAEPFSFLGLKGDFDIFIDKVLKIPVQVSGKISGLGKVKIRLHRIELKK
jgi:hypothetical protein